MKSTIRAISWISGLMAVVTVIVNFSVIFGGQSWFFRFAMFSVVRGGGIMGYLGNLMSMLLVAVGFGAMFFFGLHALKSGSIKSVRSALTAGGLMSLLALISLICSIAKGMFNFGDLIMLAMPVVYTLFMFMSSDKL